MGTTFSTIQIKNSMKVTPKQFEKLICKYFKKKGLVLATEDEAQLTYCLAFSSKSDWVTLSFSEYEPGAKCVHEDAEGISESLKTYCIVTSVIDSDVLCLDLFDSINKQKDSINLGRLDYGIPESKGIQKLWEPLMKEETSWEQITKIYDENYIYLEDALTEIAPLLGMDSENITKDYDYWDSVDNTSVIKLYLKKEQTVGKKVVSFQVAFKQLFSEALVPHGFVKLKGKQPYFVRVVNDEIIHVIALKNENSLLQNYKSFSIIGGVATIYRQKIDLTKSPRDNGNWLHHVCTYYSKLNPEKHGDNVWESLYRFTYELGDNIAMLSKLKHSLKATEQFILPVLNEVIDIESCIEYLYKFGPPMILYEDFGTTFKIGQYNHYDEGLLLIKTDKYGERYTRFRGEGCRVLDARDAFLNDRELYVKAFEELKRRKIVNTETLQFYGFNL